MTSRIDRTSLRDVARLAGVSAATVSRVLSGSSHPVSDDTRARVQAAAQRLNFEPNRLARALVTARSQTLGVIVHDVADPYFGEILRGLEDAVGADGYSIFVSSSDRDPEKELGYVRAFMSQQVDAIVFAASGLNNPDYVAQLAELLGPYRRRGGVAVALSDRAYPLPNVRLDNRKAAMVAVSHLVELGHHRIGYLGGPPELFVSERRLEGYVRALEEAGIPFDPDLVVPGDFSLEGGRRATDNLLYRGVSAVCAATDIMAIGVIRELLDRGVDVPAEVSVVGIDDVAMAEYAAVPLTTIRIPTTELGRGGGRLVMELLRGDPAQSQLLEPELVVRQSTTTASPPRGAR